MKQLIILVAVLVVASASYYPKPAYPLYRKFHSQNDFGQYVYGYASGLAAQKEFRTPDGVTKGGYSYIDANGILQTVQYVADPVNGFRVSATNLPQGPAPVHELPEVARARAQHLAAFEKTKVEHAIIAAKLAGPVAISPIPVGPKVVAPIKSVPVISPVAAYVQHAPVVYTPLVLTTQYHKQDSFGQYSYGYVGPHSSKTETKTADGVTRGGYSYIDANGILQTVQYVADPIHGFQVIATNLPKAPEVQLIGPKVSAVVSGPKSPSFGPIVVADHVEPISNAVAIGLAKTIPAASVVPAAPVIPVAPVLPTVATGVSVKASVTQTISGSPQPVFVPGAAPITQIIAEPVQVRPIAPQVIPVQPFPIQPQPVQPIIPQPQPVQPVPQPLPLQPVPNYSIPPNPAVSQKIYQQPALPGPTPTTYLGPPPVKPPTYVASTPIAHPSPAYIQGPATPKPAAYYTQQIEY